MNHYETLEKETPMKSLSSFLLVGLLFFAAAPSAMAIKVVSSTGTTDCKAKSQNSLFANTNPRRPAKANESKMRERVSDRRKGTR